MSGKYKQGRRAFGEQPGRRGNDRWDKNIVKLEKPPMRKHVSVRAVGGTLTVGVHYIKFKSPKDGQFTGFMVQCPNWNLAEQADEDNGCPICRDFHWNLPIEDKKFEYLKMPQKYRYLFHAFHVTNIKKGAEPTFGVIETHTLGMDDIEEALLLRGNQPDDPQHGYCLNWLRKEAKSKQFKEETKFSAGDDLPVTEIRDGVWGLKLGSKKVKGEEQDLLAIIPSPPTVEELEKKLADLGLYAVLDKVVGSGSRGTSRSRASDADADAADDVDDTEWNESEAGGSEDAGEDWDESEEETTSGETEAADPDDDDWEEEAAVEEADAPEAKSEVEEADNWDDDDKPEPVPPKTTKKKSTKKAAKKKTAKKAAKKQSEPEPDGDADDNDWDDDDWD